MPSTTAAGPTDDGSVVVLAHNKVRLALHRLRADPGPGAGAAPPPRSPAGRHPLLVLHGLGERTPAQVPAEVAGWPGAIWGLDFTGHGASTVPRGGGYTCELLVADADIALADLGPTTLWGRGLGGYVAVLLGGARPTVVRGVVVADGPGLDGGGTGPSTVALVTPDPRRPHPDTPLAPDPYALHELARDVRPPEYAVGYARQAVRHSGLERAIAVCAAARPPWLAAVVAEPGVATVPLAEAHRFYASASAA